MRSKLALLILILLIAIQTFANLDKNKSVNKLQLSCELEAINIGTRLSDRYNNFDELTDWDVRMHHDFLVKYLGFAGWMQSGLWKNTKLTAFRNNAPEIMKAGGWIGAKSIQESPYWALEDKWLYMMGDSTQRQIWATIVSPLNGHDFERNAKEWTRENCGRQYPKRKNHPAGHFFHEEGWGGNCGNNELTCHMSGFGKEGKITFDWKHFPWEDYDEWLFGDSGLWKHNATTNEFPDVLVIHVGLHTCVHTTTQPITNQSMIDRHEADITTMMQGIQSAINRTPKSLKRTHVIIQPAGRTGNSDARADHCSRHFNRLLVSKAHEYGFSVLEREEIERRLLFKSEHFAEHRTIKNNLHLEAPAPNIIASSLLGLISCIQRNGTNIHREFTVPNTAP